MAKSLCTGCGSPGEPYTYRGEEFDGLVAFQGERYCRPCSRAALNDSFEAMSQDAPLDVLSISRCARNQNPVHYGGRGRYTLG